MKCKHGESLSLPEYNVSKAGRIAFRILIKPQIREIEGDIVVKVDTSLDRRSWEKNYAMMIFTIEPIPKDESINPIEEIISISPVFNKINYLKLYIENETNNEIDIEIILEFKNKQE